MTITVGVPTTGYINHQFVSSLCGLVGSGLVQALNIVPRLPIHQARTRIVETTETSHLLFVDDDMVFTPQDVQYLIEANKDFVAGLCYSRTDKDTRPVVFKWHEDRQRFDFTGFIGDRLQRVDGTTLAFTLINMDVFKQVGSRFVFGVEPPFGEDEEFIHRLRHAEIPMYLDSRAKVGHITQKVI